MRIAMLTPLPGRTHPSHEEPIRRMIALLADGLADRGIEVTLFPTPHRQCPAPRESMAAYVCSEAPPSCGPDASQYLEIRDVFDRADDFDLIHNHAGFVPVTYAGLISRPILTTVHECTVETGLPILRRFNGKAYFVAVSNSCRWQDLAYEATICYGIDVESFTFSDGCTPHLLFCGAIDSNCGLEEVIEVSRVTRKPLVITGTISDDRYFSTHIAPLLDEDHIRYVEPVDQEVRHQLLGSAMALFYTARPEVPFDFAGLEANACGTPVITISRDAPPEFIIQGINGFVVPGVKAATEAVERLHDFSRALCRKFAEERLSVRRMVDEYLGVYESVLEKTKTEDRRPWGYYVVLSDLPDHKVKRIVVWPGKRLSLQRHRLRSEHWTIIAGSPVVTINGKEISLRAGQSIDIPVGAEHRIYNPGQDPVVFVEVQMGEYFGEDDIERFEDDFGRF